MAKITEKNTKAEILAAYNEALERLDAQDNMKDDPIAEKANEEKTRVFNSADEVVDMDILNPEITKKYTDLKTAIDLTQKELEELYGIQAKANSFVALINAYKDKTVQLENEYKDLKESKVKELEEVKSNLINEIDTLKVEKKEAFESIRKESQELKNTLAKEHAREEEDYKYNLTRTRKLENDKWEDEKATREKELATKEEELDDRLDYMRELEGKVQLLTDLNDSLKLDIETARKEGYDKGKADANKSNAFEVRELKTKNEYEQKALQDRVAHLEESLETEREAKELLQDKLDSAYTQMKELASETVKSSGGVKILNSENNTK